MAKKDKEYILRPEIWLKELQKKKNIIKRFKQMSMTFLVCLSERIMLS